MNNRRDPQVVFWAAISAGRLSANPKNVLFAGNYMYMGDDAKGVALFKNIISRAYLPEFR